MDKNIKALQLRYRLYGLSADWFDCTFDNTGLAQPEADRLKNAFSSIRRGSVVYIEGSAGPVVNQYIDIGLTVRGVDASLYISDPFDKVEKKGLPENADVVVLYNIYEGTTQVPLMQKVLKKLVNSFGGGTMVILCGDIPCRAFSRDYFQVQNSCSIPKKKEEKWL